MAPLPGPAQYYSSTVPLKIHTNIIKIGKWGGAMGMYPDPNHDINYSKSISPLAEVSAQGYLYCLKTICRTDRRRKQDSSRNNNNLTTFDV